MNAVADSIKPGQFDENALRRNIGSIRHPLTRALLALTFTTGLVDAVSYLGLGRVFTANMTGNIVLLGFGVARSGGLPVLAPIVSLGAFIVGSATGGGFVRQLDNRHPALVARALGVEFCLIGVAAILAAATSPKPGHPSAYLMIALLAFTMGVRSTTVRRYNVPDISTVVLTMTLSSLASATRLTGGYGRDSSRRLAAVVAMFIGAVAGALLLKTDLWIPLALASVLALLVGLIYLPAAVRRGARPRRPT